GRKGEPGYKPPTTVMKMNFREWLQLAKNADETKLESEADHYYFMVGTGPGQRTGHFVADDLPFFSTYEPNFFITNVAANKGIQCRYPIHFWWPCLRPVEPD